MDVESSEGGGSRERTLLPNQAMGMVSAVLLLAAMLGLALAQMPVPPGGRLTSGTGYGGAAVLETPELSPSWPAASE